MSERHLKKLLEELANDLDKAGNEWRDDNSLETHAFKVSATSIANQVMQDIVGKKLLPPEGISDEHLEYLKGVVKTYSDNIAKSLYTKWTNPSGKYASPEVFVPSSSWTNFTIYTSLRLKSDEFRTVKGKKQWVGTSIGTVFGTIRNSYKSERRTLKNNVNKALALIAQESGLDVKQYEKGEAILNLGHKGGFAISEQRIAETKKVLAAQKLFFKQGAEPQGIEDVLKDLGISISLRKVDKSEGTIVELSIESDYLNTLKGRTTESAVKKAYVKKLREAAEKDLSKFGLTEGSDSSAAQAKKKIIKSFQDSVKGKVKKPKTSDTKIKKSSGKKVSIKRTQKAKKGQTQQADLKDLGLTAPKTRKKQPRAGQSNISLAALINQRLAAVIAKNMKAPGLQHRTGRFAGSAEVVDVTQTAKGYPSIGYTYQKNPYQTFEPGFAQGSADRDPRKVIDQSIREIALGLIEGRFYTRRV